MNLIVYVLFWPYFVFGVFFNSVIFITRVLRMKIGLPIRFQADYFSQSFTTVIYDKDTSDIGEIKQVLFSKMIVESNGHLYDVY